MRTLRRISSWIHLYGGLALGVFLILISVSGSALMFKDTIDRWLRPDLRVVEPAGDRVSMDRMLTAVREAHPEATPWIAELPGEPTEPLVVRLGPEAPSVYVDPYRATVLGSRSPDEGIVNTLSALHVDLLAGTTGHILVGVTGLLLVLLTGTGLVLWWPRRLKALGQALRVAWRHGALRFNYDLHRAGGFYTALFLVLTSLTGSAFVFYPTTQQLIATLTASDPWPPAPPTVAEEQRPDAPSAVSYEQVLEAAQQVLPKAESTFLTFPSRPDAPVAVRMRTPPEWHPNGRSQVYVRPGDAAVLRVDDARTAPGGAQLLQTFYPLHIGAVGGLLVKWLYAVLGLAPTVLSVTGTVIWYRRWRRLPSSTPDRDEVGTRTVQLPPRNDPAQAPARDGEPSSQSGPTPRREGVPDRV